MKVVLFCGGLGMRLHPTNGRASETSGSDRRKTIVMVSNEILLLFRTQRFHSLPWIQRRNIKKFFLNYDECLSNDFTLSKGGKERQLLKSDIEDWRITFVETGLNSNIGQRLKAVEKYLNGEEIFLANYSDGLTNLHLPDMVDFFIESMDKIGCFLAVKPFYVFHVVQLTQMVL